MSILEKLLGLGAEEDLTESGWWTETIYRGLEQAGDVEESFDGAADSGQSRGSTPANA